MNAQFKKGVLELIVLAAVEQKDMYGYELVAEVSKVVNVKEGTIYPILKRLTNEHYFETYLRESTEGPPRKYYHLTAAGNSSFKRIRKGVGRIFPECESIFKGEIVDVKEGVFERAGRPASDA